LLAKQPIVVSMTPNPEPEKPVRGLDREGAIVRATRADQKRPTLLEVEGGMARILFQALVRLIGEFPSLRERYSAQKSGKRDGSDGGGLAGCVVTKRPGRQIVEASCRSIALDLSVPDRPVVLQKPGAKLGQLFRGERLDVSLDLVDFAHTLSVGDFSLTSCRAEDRRHCLRANASTLSSRLAYVPVRHGASCRPLKRLVSRPLAAGHGGRFSDHTHRRLSASSGQGSRISDTSATRIQRPARHESWRPPESPPA
jgi:hypothetical protein